MIDILKGQNFIALLKCIATRPVTSMTVDEVSSDSSVRALLE